MLVEEALAPYRREMAAREQAQREVAEAVQAKREQELQAAGDAPLGARKPEYRTAWLAAGGDPAMFEQEWQERLKPDLVRQRMHETIAERQRGQAVSVHHLWAG